MVDTFTEELIDQVLADPEFAKGIFDRETLAAPEGVELKKRLIDPENFSVLQKLLLRCEGATQQYVAGAIRDSALLKDLTLPPEKWFELIQGAKPKVSVSVSRALTYNDDDFSRFKKYLLENPEQFVKRADYLPHDFFIQLFNDKNFSEHFFAQYDAKTFYQIPLPLLTFFRGEPDSFGLQAHFEQFNEAEREKLAETALQEALSNNPSTDVMYSLLDLLGKYVKRDHPILELIDPKYAMREIIPPAASDEDANEKKQKAAIVLINRANIPRTRKDELIARIKAPFVMNQEQNLLCGPVTFWMQLAEIDPVRYAQVAIQLLTARKMTIANPATRNTLQLENTYSEEKMKSRSIDMIMSSALRRASNRTGLYASSKSVPQQAEALMGYTSSQDFVNWYKLFFGDVPISDTTQLQTQSGSPLSTVWEGLIGMKSNPAYSQLDENLDLAIAERKKGGCVAMLMTVGLTDQIIRASRSIESVSYDPKKDKHVPIVGLELAHYVKVNDLQITSDEEGKKCVNICMDTYTHRYLAVIPYDDFLKGYRGFISAQPTIKLELQQKFNLFVPAQPSTSTPLSPDENTFPKPKD